MLRRTSIFSFYSATPLRLLTVIKMPALSPTMETGNLVAWEMKVGDKIEENSLLAKVQTDKATNDFNYVGDECYLARIIAEAGSTIEVGQAVALAVEDKAEIDGDEVKNWKPKETKKSPAAAPAKPAAAAAASQKPQQQQQQPTTNSNTSTPAAKTSSSSSTSTSKVTDEMFEAIERSGPAVLRLATSLTTDQIISLFSDKKKFAPSGLRNRFTKSDILAFFPKVDFSVPNPSSPFVGRHGGGEEEEGASSAASSKTSSASDAETKSNQKVSSPSSTFYNISGKIIPGVPGKMGISDDAVLKYLIAQRR